MLAPNTCSRQHALNVDSLLSWKLQQPGECMIPAGMYFAIRGGVATRQ
jgi:hypothetical protein